MDVRNDIYPITPETKKYLEAMAKRTQEAFPTLFPTVDAVTIYVNNFKNPKIAGLFLNVGNYCNAVKYYTCPKCNLSQHIQTCSSCSSTLEIPAFTVLIMTMSVLEKLSFAESSNVQDWVDFYDWVNRKDVDAEYTQMLRKGKFRDFTALAESLKGRWSKEFASITKVTNFLRENMSPEEKIALIKSIKYLQTVPDLSSQTFTDKENIRNYVKKNPTKTIETPLPACFESREYWKCYTTSYSPQGYCFDKADCPVIADKGKRDKCFKDTITTIYEWRNSFIHDAQLPPLREQVIYGVRHKGKYVIAELTTAKFIPVFEALVKKFFDSYQVPRSKKSAK